MAATHLRQEKRDVVIFEPKHKFGKVSADTMLQAILVANKAGGDKRTFNLAQIICGVYGMDVPWFWHLDRVIATYPAESFDSAEWIPTFISFYVDFVNKIAQEIFDTTGVYLGLEGHDYK